MAERKTSSTNYQNQSFLETKCALNEGLTQTGEKLSDLLGQMCSFGEHEMGLLAD